MKYRQWKKNYKKKHGANPPTMLIIHRMGLGGFSDIVVNLKVRHRKRGVNNV